MTYWYEIILVDLSRIPWVQAAYLVWTPAPHNDARAGPASSTNGSRRHAVPNPEPCWTWTLHAIAPPTPKLKEMFFFLEYAIIYHNMPDTTFPVQYIPIYSNINRLSYGTLIEVLGRKKSVTPGHIWTLTGAKQQKKSRQPGYSMVQLSKATTKASRCCKVWVKSVPRKSRKAPRWKLW